MPPAETDTTVTQTPIQTPPPPDPAPLNADDGDGGTLLGRAGAPEASEGDQGSAPPSAAPPVPDPAGTPPAEGAAPEAPDDGTVPEKYDLVVTIKDEAGADVPVEIDSVLLGKADPVLREVGLSNAQANKLAPLVFDIQQRALDLQTAEFDGVKADWAKAAQADPELGGRNWKETEALAARALDTFGAPKGSPVRQLLDDSGLGNHPEIIRLFREIGKRLTEDGNPPSAPGKPVVKSREEVLYPDDVPQKQGVS